MCRAVLCENWNLVSSKAPLCKGAVSEADWGIDNPSGKNQ